MIEHFLLTFNSKFLELRLLHDFQLPPLLNHPKNLQDSHAFLATPGQQLFWDYFRPVPLPHSMKSSPLNVMMIPIMTVGKCPL
jgi:hypothetical protein